VSLPAPLACSRRYDNHVTRVRLTRVDLNYTFTGFLKTERRRSSRRAQLAEGVLRRGRRIMVTPTSPAAALYAVEAPAKPCNRRWGASLDVSRAPGESNLRARRENCAYGLSAPAPTNRPVCTCTGTVTPFLSRKRGEEARRGPPTCGCQ
jgi:hypothetical protein